MYTTLALCLFNALVLVSANNEFIVPPPAGTDAVLGSPLNVQWRCDDCGSTPVTLTLWQNRDDGVGGWAQETLLDGVENTGSYNWSPHTLESLDISHGFHFELTFGNLSFDSGALFIRDTISSSSMSSSAASSTTTTTSATTTSIPTTSPTSAPTSFSTISTSSTVSIPAASVTLPTNPNNHSNDTLKVGLGAGLGVGIPFLLLVGGITGYILFKRRSKARQQAAYGYTNGKGGLPAYSMAVPVQELSGDGMRAELYEQRGPGVLQG